MIAPLEAPTAPLDGGGIDFSNHPCFDPEAHRKFGRIHLPVAPRCNIQCNFCNRKFDCINESRPGVTSSVLTPHQALAYLENVLARRPEITVVGIAGPGDPFANAEETMETLRLVRKRHPKMILCLASNGMRIGPHIDEIAALKVSHVTLTITSIDPEIGARIYAWVRDGKRPLRGVQGAQALQARQIEAISRLKERGVVVKVNSIIIPGVNDDHLTDVARKVRGLGADLMNCMALVPVKESAFEAVPPPDTLMTARVRLQCGQYLKQMSHCARCRADAVGFLGEEMSAEQHNTLQQFARMSPRPDENHARPYVAVATMEGALVNQHLGEATRITLYGRDEAIPGVFKFVEIRKTPTEGTPDRWNKLADLLGDCRAILVTAAGPTPQKILSARGLKIVEMEGLIDEGLEAVYADQPVPAPLRRRFTSCGAGVSCRGTGNGCG
ncbi:MAG: nitrogenase cofactor biosynthesis protein NifB [Verrucomicrobiales bacterium]|nr:nitrogenase cofactor biosynthesis protein NifB [Verrucomicrobiales bacterium]